MERVLAAVRPAIVTVLTRPSADAGRDPARAAAGRSGHGFIVDPNGFIVTTSETVRGAGLIEVRLADGRTLPVTFIGRDPLRNVAVLKIAATGLSPLPLGKSNALRVGDVVMAIGKEPGAGGVTVTTIRATGGRQGRNLGVNVPLASKTAGGPLVNARGEVVGIATAAAQPAGVPPAPGFAIPIDRVKPLLQDLRSQPAATPGGSTGALESQR